MVIINSGGVPGIIPLPPDAAADSDPGAVDPPLSP
jgi:hypothetical protein